MRVQIDSFLKYDLRFDDVKHINIVLRDNQLNYMWEGDQTGNKCGYEAPHSQTWPEFRDGTTAPIGSCFLH